MRQWHFYTVGVLSSLLLLSIGFGVLPARPTSSALGAPLAQAPAFSPTPTPTPAPAPTSNQALSLQAGQLAIDGQALVLQGDAQGGLQKEQQALALFQQAGDLSGQALTLASIGQAYYEIGEDTQALDAEQRSLALAKQVGDPSLLLTPLQQLALVNDTLGKFDAALDFDQQALAVATTAGDTGSQETILNGTGGIYLKLGQYDQALGVYQRALSLARNNGEKDNEDTALLSLGHLYDAEEQYLQALDYDQQALTLAQSQASAESQPGGDPLKALLFFYAQATALNNIGTVYSALNQPAKALEYFQQVLPLTQALKDNQGQEDAYNNLGSAYGDEGQQDQALNEYQQALMIAQQIGDKAGQETALNNIGYVYNNEGQPDKAQGYYQQALTTANDLNDRASQLIYLNNIGSTYDSEQQYDQALTFFQQSLALARDLSDSVDQRIALSNIGLTYEHQGDQADALDAYDQAIALDEGLRASVKLEEFKTSLGSAESGLYQQTMLVLLGLGRPADAFNVSEQARARTFLDQLGNAPLDVTKGADPQLLQQEQSLSAEVSTLDGQLRDARSAPPDQQNPDLIQSLSQQVQAAEQQYTETLTQLKLSDPETASLVSVAPLHLGDVQQLLDANTTLLSYIITPDKTLAFIVTQSGFQEVDLPVKQSDLEQAVADFRGFADTTSATPPQSLQQLYGWLIAPLASQLTTPVVGIIPDGILNDLSFAALTPDGQTYFGEAHTLFELPDASSLPFIQAKRKGTDASALVLANSQPAGFPALQYVAQEATNVAGLLGTQPLLDQAATETAVEQQGGSVNVLHLAAHAELNSAAPLFSRILLAPDSQNDGSLTVQQVYGLNLAQADLVVLSACDTQLGGQTAGDDFTALNRAFIFAGAPSVVASLWVVNDQATSVLMTAFYQHLTGGMSKAQALQAAQADTRAQFPNPYYWAAFVLTGAP